uniref:Uncharacterized protein n=1 Tax=viral metagenome TaxID=1070528 RepID=A0A6C0JAP8_9ZZZZ
MLNINASEVFRRAIKYLVEGLAVAAAAFYIPRKKMNLQEILMIAVTAAAALSVLDLLAPSIGKHARHGAGFGIGTGLVGANKMPFPGIPGLL